MEKRYLTLMNQLIKQINQLSKEIQFNLNNKDCKQIEIDIEYLKFYLDLMKKINIKYGMEISEDFSYTIPIYKSSNYEYNIKKETKRVNKDLLLSVSSLIVAIITLIIVIF